MLAARPPFLTHAARGALAATAFCLVALVGPAAAQSVAPADWPARVGRVAVVEGPVQLQPAVRGDGQPTVAVEQPRNWPLAAGDQLQVGPGGRAEFSVGSTTVRLGERTRLEIVQLDEQALRLQLSSGSLALRLRNDDVARSTEVLAGAFRMQAEAPGLFRVDAEPGAVSATAWQSAWRVAGPDSLVTLRSGQRLVLDPAGRQWRFAAPASDRFAAWAMVEDAPAASAAWVSPEMTGQDDLARHGDWQVSEEWGPVWLPRQVGPDWAPYRDGQWAWVAPWGWTWVDAAPWGFAPFHYGRWVQWRQRWAWVPGQDRARPVYAPALVVWLGAPRVVDGPHPGQPRWLPPPVWRPLPPHEPYVPVVRPPWGAGDSSHRPRLPDPVVVPMPRGRDEDGVWRDDPRRRIPPQPRWATPDATVGALPGQPPRTMPPIATPGQLGVLPSPPVLVPAPSPARGFPPRGPGDVGGASVPAAGRSVFSPVPAVSQPPVVSTPAPPVAMPAPMIAPMPTPAPPLRRERPEDDLRRRPPELPRLAAPPLPAAAPVMAPPIVQAAPAQPMPPRTLPPFGRRDEGGGARHGRGEDERRFPRGAQ